MQKLGQDLLYKGAKGGKKRGEKRGRKGDSLTREIQEKKMRTLKKKCAHLTEQLVWHYLRTNLGYDDVFTLFIVFGQNKTRKNKNPCNRLLIKANFLCMLQSWNSN